MGTGILVEMRGRPDDQHAEDDGWRLNMPAAAIGKPSSQICSRNALPLPRAPSVLAFIQLKMSEAFRISVSFRDNTDEKAPARPRLGGRPWKSDRSDVSKFGI